jgi:hypothetical protein
MEREEHIGTVSLITPAHAARGPVGVDAEDPLDFSVAGRIRGLLHVSGSP